MAQADEVSFTQYRDACAAVERLGNQLKTASPDEAAEHHLPELTREVSLIFGFVGVNMTARHVPRFTRTVEEMEAAKAGTLQEETQPQEEQADGSISDERPDA